jgi:lysophospholipase L1-like esterase
MSFASLDQIWMLGDSMTQMSFGEDGIGARFAGVSSSVPCSYQSSSCHRSTDTYVRKLDVINRGYGGYNSRWDAIVFEQTFPTRAQREAQSLPCIRLLTIWLGTNDCVEEGRPQYVSPADFQLELAKIISITRERSPETRIILITPGPQQIARLERNFYLPHDPPIKIDRSNAQAELYVKATIELGTKEGVPVVNIWDPLWEAAGSRDENALERYYSDGLHLAAPGYKVYEIMLLHRLLY